MIIDVIVGAILVISAVIAFLRGFIREVLTIIGVVGGAAAAYAGGPALTPHMDGWLGVKEGAEPQHLFGVLPYDILSLILSYGLIFIVVVVALSVVSHMLSVSAKALGLGPVDRTLGVAFGLVRGVLLLGLFYLPVYMLVDKETKTSWFEGSRTYFYLEKTSGMIVDFLPDESRRKIEEKAGEIEDAQDTREKLQSIDVLRGGQKQADEAPPAPEQSRGYNDEFRENMDQLFEEKTRTPNNE
jgi:membrane protein required for colicin V production